MFRSFAKAAAAAAAVFVLSAAAHAQGAPLQLSQALDPPGTADLKPQVESKKPVKSSAAKRHTAAPKAVPVDAGTAARAAPKCGLLAVWGSGATAPEPYSFDIIAFVIERDYHDGRPTLELCPG